MTIELIPMFCIVLSMLLIDVLAIGLVVISVVHEILVFNIYLIFFSLVNQSRPQGTLPFKRKMGTVK